VTVEIPTPIDTARKNSATGAAQHENASSTPSETPSGRKRRERKGVHLDRMMLMVFPPHVEHPESTGRLELFALYGPTDDDGRLRGGIRGSHVHTDLEIRRMIQHETREALFSLFKRPRATVESIVDTLMPLAMSHNYTQIEVRKLLRDVPVEADGGMDFEVLQEVILASQRRRLEALINDGVAKKERGHKVPYQSKARDHLLAPIMKKKYNEQEEQLGKQKRAQNYCSLVAGLDEQNMSIQLAANVTLVRGLGRVDDKWDRYCALRRVGKASYVGARNGPQNGLRGLDDGLGNKHAGCASLVSSMMVARP